MMMFTRRCVVLNDCIFQCRKLDSCNFKVTQLKIRTIKEILKSCPMANLIRVLCVPVLWPCMHPVVQIVAQPNLSSIRLHTRRKAEV